MTRRAKRLELLFVLGCEFTLFYASTKGIPLKMSMNAKEFEYYDSYRANVGLFKSYAIILKNIVSSRSLIFQLYKRDYLAGHRRSFLSYFWILLSPLLGIASWVFMNYGGFLNPGNVGVPYPAYVLLGTSIWGLGIGLYHASLATLTSTTSLVTQIRYPHEIIVVKQVLVFLANYLLGLGANILLVRLLGVELGFRLLLFPFLLIPLVLLTVGIGLVMSMITVVISDLSNLVNAGLGMLVFFSPILYAPRDDQPLVSLLMKWNPLTHLVCSPRDWLLYGRLYDNQGFLWCSVIAFFIFALSFRLFFLAENRLVEKMS